MRIVFLGTSSFAVPTLEAVAGGGHDVALVVTQPDRPAGRGQKLAASPVKEAALRLGLPVFQPEKIGAVEARRTIAQARPEAILTASYGQILGPKLLALPPRGCWNVHASLLPRHRGATPVHRAILAGDARTGITIFRMVPAMDAGPLLVQEAIEIGAEETAGELEERLARLGADCARECLRRLAADPPPEPVPQDDAGATLAPRLEKRDGLLDFARPARAVADRVRGLSPWPGAFGFLARQGREERLRLRVHKARPAEGSGSPGTVIEARPEGIRVACGEGAVDLVLVQPENRKVLKPDEFINGFGVRRGDRFVLEASAPRDGGASAHDEGGG